MKRKETNSKTPSSFWLEGPVGQAKETAAEPLAESERAFIAAGFLSNMRGGVRLKTLDAFLSLALNARPKATFQDRLMEVSLSRDERILAQLRREEILEFAGFYYAIEAMGLTTPQDSLVLLDFHAVRAPAGPFFDDFELLRLEEIWCERPGALEQSMLARFLAPAMPEAVSHRLIGACETAGFLTRRATVRNAVVVASTGVMEEILADCLRDMRPIGNL